MNEDEFEYNGKTYVTVNQSYNFPCEGCAFYKEEDEDYFCKLRNAGKIPPWSWKLREDGIESMFVEK